MIKEIRNGILAFLGFLLFYFLVMGVTSRSFEATILQFKNFWFGIILLSSGFGVQIGLYTKLKIILKNKKEQTVSKKLMAVGTGTSAFSMVACCSHHLTEVLPILGLSVFSIFLIKYQTLLIVLSFSINLFGIWHMVRIIKKLNS